ncbi:MAG TPA: hypothetical protein VGV68_15990 [Terriglobia bacterium]|nr:hypothetical protein [Terriglobia bacterium]
MALLEREINRFQMKRITDVWKIPVNKLPKRAAELWGHIRPEHKETVQEQEEVKLPRTAKKQKTHKIKGQGQPPDAQ